MKNVRVWISPLNQVVIETWDRSYELEVAMSVADARQLANELLELAAEAGANLALEHVDVV